MLSVPALGSIVADSNSKIISATDFFFKDGRKISVGDCALFKTPRDTLPPFIGIIRCLSSDNADSIKLGVNWLYRPPEVKLSKGISLDAALNEIFYSFHKDVIPAALLLHPCKVSFLREGVELPSGISSFVCRRVYDTTDKCLRWLTDRDYINERQEEVDKLLEKTQVEMHAQPEGCSPKPLNGPSSATQLKPCSDSVHNSSTLFSSQVKGKKRERVDQGSEPIKRERFAKTEDGDTGNFRPESMLRSEIAKITNKGGLVDYEGVEKLVQLMQFGRAERKLDLASCITLADVIAATESFECLARFVQNRGLSVLDEWLQEVHKGKISDSIIPKENDKSVDEFLFALLRALDKLPVNLHALQTCNVGKSVNNLRSHKNLEIQKKARSLVDTWKKRVEAEMKINDAKSASSQAISWPSKPAFPDVSQGGNRRPGASSVVPMKRSITQPSTYKTASVKHGQGDGSARSSASPGSVKTLTSFPAPVVVSSKDLKEERSSSSSQSQNNSQSCSSDQIKTVGSVWKEDARSSTAGSPNVNKTSTGASRHRRSSNGVMAAVSGVQKETSLGKSGSLNISAISEKVSQSGLTCERTASIPVHDNGNSPRLIVRLTNPGRSPVRSASGCSHDDSSVMVSRVSSPGPFEKPDQYDRKVNGKSDSCPNMVADVKAESWQSNDVKDGFAGSDEGSPATVDEEHCKTGDDIGKPTEASRATCSSTKGGMGVFSSGINSGNSSDATLSSITALIESCVKYSEASACIPVGDDGMNLLASVAAGEMSTSDLDLPDGSPRRNSPAAKNSYMGNDSKIRLLVDDLSARSKEKSDDGSNGYTKKQSNVVGSCVEDRLHVARFAGDGKSTSSFLEEKQTVGTSGMDLPQAADPCPKSHGEPDERAAASPTVSTAVKDEEGARSEGANQLFDKQEMGVIGSDEDGVQDLRLKVNSSFSNGTKKDDNTDEKIAESNITVASDFFCGSKLEGCDIDNGALSEKGEKEVIEISPSYPSLEMDGEIKKHVKEGSSGGISTEKRLSPGAMNPTEVVEERGNNMVLRSCSNSVLYPDSVIELKSEKVIGGETRAHVKQRQNKNMGHASNVPPTCDIGVGCGDHDDGGAKDKSEWKEILEQCAGGSVLQEELSTTPVQETELCIKFSGSKASNFQAKEMEECISNAEASSVSVTEGVDKTTKLGFDLNEGFPADDVNQGESVSSTEPGCLSGVHLPSQLPFPVSSMASSPGLVTVAAAKGSFVPPQNPLKSTGEHGWRGSAATSAFRPAEPRKVFEMPLTAPDIYTDIPFSKHGRPPLNIDLNVPDKRVFDDMASQSSGQVVGSESGLFSCCDLGHSEIVGAPSTVRSAGELDLDLNRADEGTDIGHLSASSICRLEVPFLPVRSSSSSVFPNGGVNVLRDFDLNNGPDLDEVGSEPGQSGQHAKSCLPYLPPVTGFRMNNADLGSISSWFPLGNSYSAVAIPSILPDKGEQSYSIVANAGMQRILRPLTGSTTLDSDVYQGPVLSSLPAVPFSAPSPFPYHGFPFSSSIPIPSTTFSGVSTTYMNSSSSGGLYFPAVPSQLVGPAGAVSSHYPRPYVINLPDGSISVGTESSRKWGRQGLDLNAGPGSTDTDIRDERFLSMSRQLPVASSHTLVEEHVRMYQAAGGVLESKEPEGRWDAERFSYKQTSWQ